MLVLKADEENRASDAVIDSSAGDAGADIPHRSRFSCGAVQKQDRSFRHCEFVTRGEAGMSNFKQEKLN